MAGSGHWDFLTTVTLGAKHSVMQLSGAAVPLVQAQVCGRVIKYKGVSGNDVQCLLKRDLWVCVMQWPRYVRGAQGGEQGEIGDW